MHKVTLTKIESNHNNVRSDVIEGECVRLPAIGEPFTMAAKPLDPDASFRWFCSTRVTNVTFGNGKDEYLFRTLNSLYKLKVHVDED